ncbi:hypothetical protein BHM03_00056693, partial [Ensete ventricosum]
FLEFRGAGSSFSQKDALALSLPPSTSLPCAGDGCPLRTAAALPRGGHPCGQRRCHYWRPPLTGTSRAGCSRLCPRATAAPTGGRPLQGAWPQPVAPVQWGLGYSRPPPCKEALVAFGRPCRPAPLHMA